MTPTMIAPGTKVYELVEELVKYLPEEMKEKFVEKHENTNWLRDKYDEFVANRRFALNDIVRFADAINRDPGIVLGRLKNDGLVGFDDWTMKPIKHKYKVKTVY